MEYESDHNNPRDPLEEIIERLEAHVTNINCNMNLLMVVLSSKLRSFEDEGGFNSGTELKGKLGDNEDLEKESYKEPMKEQPSSCVVNPS